MTTTKAELLGHLAALAQRCIAETDRTGNPPTGEVEEVRSGLEALDGELKARLKKVNGERECLRGMLKLLRRCKYRFECLAVAPSARAAEAFNKKDMLAAFNRLTGWFKRFAFGPTTTEPEEAACAAS